MLPAIDAAAQKAPFYRGLWRVYLERVSLTQPLFTSPRRGEVDVERKRDVGFPSPGALRAADLSLRER